MTTENILTRVNEALNEIDHGVTPRGTLQSLADDLQTQLRHEIAASRGTLNATKTLLAILKPNEKCRPALAYPWIDAAGRQCICDGFQVFRLNPQHHHPLPERPENAGPGVDIDKIIGTNGVDAGSFPFELDMPSATEIRQVIAIQRAQYTGKRANFTPLYDFGEHAPTVNANLLLNVATVFPAVKTLRWKNLVSLLYFTCDDGDGAIQPVRVEGKTMPGGMPANVEPTPEPKASDERAETIPAEPAAQPAKPEPKPEPTDAERAEQAISDAIANQKSFFRCYRDATSSGVKAEYAARINEAAVAEGKARLKLYTIRAAADPEYAMEPAEFERIIKRLYVKFPA